MHRSFLSLLLALALLAVIPSLASASGVAYPDADWSQAWIPSSGGVTLHADVLRPKGATAATKTPTIISIGPYFNHSGQTGPAGPAQNPSVGPLLPPPGPDGPRGPRRGHAVRPGRAERGTVRALPGLRG